MRRRDVDEYRAQLHNAWRYADIHEPIQVAPWLDVVQLAQPCHLSGKELQALRRHMSRN